MSLDTSNLSPGGCVLFYMLLRCTFTFFTLVSCLVVAPALGGVVSPEESRAWREDLRFVQSEMPAVHPNLFHTLPHDEFDASIDTLIERLPSMAHHEIIAELAAIVAAVRDGHTRLTLPVVRGSGLFTGHSATPPPASSAMMFHYLPIRLFVYDDGLFVREISRDHAEYLGARVERIGSLSVDVAMERVTRVIHRDNEMQVLSLLPSRLVIPELLHALRITEDPTHVEFEISTGDTAPRRFVLAPVPEGSAVDWVNATSFSPERPLYLRHPDRNFWFEYLEEHDMVFCQYNEVYDDDDESIAAFSARLTDFIVENSAGALVLDLRFNRGGDNSLNRSFLHALIRCPVLQKPGSFFVIIGRNTFSAAMMFALDLEKHTTAIFVGEPSGARPNHFGDSRKVQLPNSGLTLRVSTLYWQYSGPKDDRPSLPPHIPIRFVSDDDRIVRDPAFERILELTSVSASRSPAGRWVGRILSYDIVLHLHATNGSWGATIDFPNEGATGLPLTNVRYQASSLHFDFPNGEETISFEGTIHDDTIIGHVTLGEQTYIWVMTSSE